MKNRKTRRAFIELAIHAGIVCPFLSSGVSRLSSELESLFMDPVPLDKQLKILILGGTSFLGPHQIAYAMSRGHSISTFTRGKTMPTVHIELFKNVEQLIGDRNDNLTALYNREWDVVIDNSGHRVQWTKDSAALLKEQCDLYVFTSSTGVYYPYLGENFKEEDKVLLSEPGEMKEEEKMEYWYGVMKANSELAAISEFGTNRTLIVRPTYMIGPADKSNRFIHWPVRLSRGGEILVPGEKEDPVQYIDVRDTAKWMIQLIEMKKNGTFNAVGPRESQNMMSFVREASDAFDVPSTFVQIDDYEFLKHHGIHHIVPWILPVGKNIGSAKVNNHKALQNGLTFRPLIDTVRDTYEWWKSDAVSQEQRNKAESNQDSILSREKMILEKWKKL